MNPVTTQCAVVFLGEMPYTEGKGSVEDIELFDNQQNLVKALYGKVGVARMLFVTDGGTPHIG